MKILFALEAEQDLDTAVDFLVSRKPSAAVELVDGIRLLVSRLAEGEFDRPEQKVRCESREA